MQDQQNIVWQHCVLYDLIAQQRRNENVSQISQPEYILAKDEMNKNRTIEIVLHDAVYRLIKASLPSKVIRFRGTRKNVISLTPMF
jgi:hypothetical protein